MSNSRTLRCGSVIGLAILACFPAVGIPEEPFEAQLEKLTPEEVIRYSTIAMIHSDLDKLKGYAVPNPDLHLLCWKLEGANSTEAAGVFSSVILSLKFKRLSVGDTFDSPDTTKVTITDAMVNQNRLMILRCDQDGKPYPKQHPDVVIKQDGRWRVDFSRIISNRKAAKAKATKPRVIEPEQLAAERLRLARQLMESNRDAGIRWLRRVVTEHPKTQVAKEAQELLRELD